MHMGISKHIYKEYISIYIYIKYMYMSISKHIYIVGYIYIK